MTKKAIFALLLMFSVLALAVPASAKPKPRTTTTLNPSIIHIEVADAELGMPIYNAAAFFNNYTQTKFSCAIDGPVHCQANVATCVSSHGCLKIRFGDFADDSLNARLIQSWIFNRSGTIEINAEGPLYDGINPWGPLEKTLLMEHWFGRYTRLPVNPVCTSIMYPSYACAPQSLLPVEQAHLAAW